ncbi:MAG: DUF1801 domain-containing protein [Deltaproteobacteria bacterium]
MAPKLLSGGNPQIPKGDGDAPVAAFLDATPGWKQGIVRRLDALIMDAVPKAKKAVRWNSPFYGIEGNGWFVSYHCMTKYIKVTFFQGASMKPPPPETSKQENVRYFHIHEDDEMDDKLITKWMKQAAKLPGEALF